MTPSQFRAARALLHLNLQEMAKECGLGLQTIVRFEAGVTVTEKSRSVMHATLERLGVILIDADTVHGAGVRFALPPDIEQPLTALH
jgi:transcriptional regulator with XRE-family HTH domain